MYGCSLLHSKKANYCTSIPSRCGSKLIMYTLHHRHTSHQRGFSHSMSLNLCPSYRHRKTSLILNAHKQSLTPCRHSCVKHIQWRFLVFGTKKMMIVYEETSNNEHLRKENESKIPNQTNYGRTKLIKQ